MASAGVSARDIKEIIPSGELVAFTLDNVEFGLDIDRVQEISAHAAITPVPGSPRFILGVLNLRGQIIPVLDSRLRFHLQPKEVTERTRIIILDLAGQPTGLQVDSVAEVVHLTDFTLHETSPLVAGIKSDYLSGMVTVGDRLITLINLDKLLDSREFGQRETLLKMDYATGNLGQISSGSNEQEVEANLPYVTFALGQESFGINLDIVEEITELPLVTKVPDAPAYVMGVICLRDRVIPLIDPLEILRVAPAPAGSNAESMVILLTMGETRLGMRVDSIQEIVRIREEDILPPPQTLSEAEIARLNGIVVLPDRMVSLVKILEILSGEDQAKLAMMAADHATADASAEMVQERHDLPTVVFHLGDEAYALRLHEVREIVMAGLVTPIPGAPGFIEGVLNLRGSVVPVIDLRNRFGLGKSERNSLTRIIITPIDGIPTGLVVDTVSEVVNLDERKLEAPPRVTSAGKNAYIQKVARNKNDVIFLLDLQKLLSDAETKHYKAFQHTGQDLT